MSRFKSGRPAVQPSSRPEPDEGSFPSRIDRRKVTLRLRDELVRDLKVFCAVNNLDLQQVAEDAFGAYLAERSAENSLAVQPSSRPAVHMCSVCGSSSPEETKENTHTTTTTTGRPAVQPSRTGRQPTLPGIGGELVEISRTRFDLTTRRRYAVAHKLGQGWVVVSQDGRYDEMVADWLAETNRPDPKDCPDCEGAGFIKKLYFEQDGKYVKCTHPKFGQKGGTQ